MITEDYVSFETAKLLKEKGFDECCKTIYNAGVFCSVASLDCRWNEGYGELIEEKQNSDFGIYDNAISAPTLQMAMKWLRDLYNIYIIIEPHLFKEKKATEYCFNYWIDEHYHTPYDESHPVYHPLYAKTWGSYEEACEAAIRYCLEHLI